MNILDLGLLNFAGCLEVQLEVHEKVAFRNESDTLILVEHPPVLTLGRNADDKFLLTSKDNLQKLNIDFVKIDRGGEITGHFPGQLVIYPILNLAKSKTSLRQYIDVLEKSLIKTCAVFGIGAHTREKLPGVWIDKKKIAAIGVRIKNRCTMHGAALNISPDLRYFQLFVPCGITDGTVTSIAAEIDNQPPTMTEVKKIFTEIFLNEFKNAST